MKLINNLNEIINKSASDYANNHRDDYKKNIKKVRVDYLLRIVASLICLFSIYPVFHLFKMIGGEVAMLIFMFIAAFMLVEFGRNFFYPIVSIFYVKYEVATKEASSLPVNMDYIEPSNKDKIVSYLEKLSESNRDYVFDCKNIIMRDIVVLRNHLRRHNMVNAEV